MKYILLDVPAPESTDQNTIGHYAVLRSALARLELPVAGARRLGDTAWLLPRDTAMPFVVKVAQLAGNSSTGYQVDFLEDGS